MTLHEQVEASKNRSGRIFQVETSLREVNHKKLLLNEEAFVIMICEKFMCSERTSKEYIKIAKSRIKNWMDKDWAND